MLELRCSFARVVKKNPRVQTAVCYLPNPRGVGNDWYAQAEEVVLGEKWRDMIEASELESEPFGDDQVEYMTGYDFLNLREIRIWVEWYATSAVKKLGR